MNILLALAPLLAVFGTLEHLIVTIFVVVIALGILGWLLGWFGGASPGPTVYTSSPGPAYNSPGPGASSAFGLIHWVLVLFIALVIIIFILRFLGGITNL